MLIFKRNRAGSERGPKLAMNGGTMAPSRWVNKKVLRRICNRELLSLTASAIAILSFAVQSGTASAQSKADTAAASPAIVRVDATPGHAINSFDPDSALGSSIDVLSRTSIDKVFTPHILQESLSAAWGPITYRNNSELRMAAWH